MQHCHRSRFFVHACHCVFVWCHNSGSRLPGCTLCCHCVCKIQRSSGGTVAVCAVFASSQAPGESVSKVHLVLFLGCGALLTWWSLQLKQPPARCPRRCLCRAHHGLAHSRPRSQALIFFNFACAAASVEECVSWTRHWMPWLQMSFPVWANIALPASAILVRSVLFHPKTNKIDVFSSKFDVVVSVIRCDTRVAGG